MRFRIIAALTFVTSLSLFAAGAAAARAQNTVTISPSMMPPGVMQMGTMAARTLDAAGRGQRSEGPLQKVSRLLNTLDDPGVRTMLGLTDQQADSLRKIIVDTETLTIKTGADIAVDTIDLRELLRADKPDRVAVMAKGDEISKFTSQLISSYLDAALSAKAILTPEQQKMIRTYMERGAPSLSTSPARP